MLLVRVLPPVAFVIPLYIMFNQVGLINTKVPVMLACVLINVPLIIWFLLSFFQEIPEEVEESAKVDGATEVAVVYKSCHASCRTGSCSSIHAFFYVCME